MVRSKSTCGSYDDLYHFQGRRHCLCSIQCSIDWKRKRFPSAIKSRNYRHVFHHALGGRYWFGHLRYDATFSLFSTWETCVILSPSKVSMSEGDMPWK
jgi:hypothetical protein